jgi:hypothetical protein
MLPACGISGGENRLGSIAVLPHRCQPDDVDELHRIAASFAGVRRTAAADRGAA